ncbi:unnamed protein product [Closterium sp. NIES-64]|nr:unnamed protein product [Closterium sp. NIES-64]
MHTCPLHWRQGYAEGLANSIPILARRYGNLVRANPFISPVELKRMLEGHGRVVIHYWQAWRLREYILKERYGDWKESFRQVPWLLTRFTVIDPEVQVRLDTLDRCFHRFYVRPSAARHALNYCRPVVALDGTHLISAQKAVLLIAVTIDGNQEILLLAWALVESENKDASTWFLKLFLEGFPEWARRDDASIISDRDKGLVPAAREVMPSHIPHYFCAWHLEQNLKRFGKAATAFFWRLVKCRSETKWVALVGAARRDFPDMAAYLFGPVRQQPQPQPQPAPRVPPPGARATFEGARDFVFADAREGRRAQRGQERGGNAGNGGVDIASQPEGSGFPEGNTSAYNRRGGGLAGRGGMNAPGRRARAHEGIGVPGRGGVALQGRALAGEVEECPPRAIAEGMGVPDQTSRGLVVEYGKSRSVGPPGSRGMLARDGPDLQVEGGESRLVGLLEGRGVQEQDGPALEVEGGESRLVGLLEGRGVQEQDGPALEVEGGESRLVGLLEVRGVQEQDGPALEVEGGESRLVGLLEVRGVQEQDGPALEVEGGESRLVMLLEGEDAAEQDDCGQRENIPAPGPDEPACEDDPVPVDATEDGDEAADVDGGPEIHVRTGFYRNRRGSSYRIGGIMLMHWARLFAVTLRSGIYTSNAAESINSAVRGIRMLPPTWLLASLWDWSRDKWYERKEKARCRDEYLTAAASKRLDQKKQRCQGYWFIGGDNSVGTIQTRGGENESQWRSFNVNLDARTCECGNWEEYQFPCAHAVAMCILKQRRWWRSLCLSTTPLAIFARHTTGM